jgi:hypothetical protein
MSKIVIDDKTGEKITELNPGDRIIRGKSIDYLNTTQEWKMEHFYKGNLEEIKRWMKDLVPNEKAILFTISPYVGYEDCCLKHLNGDMIAFDDIVELSCLSRGTASVVINSLIEKDILYKGKNGKERQYFVNPWLFCKGNRVNRVLKTMFRNYRIRVIGKLWKDIR